jgi:REP element-mobilizing transposase RayT
LVVHKHLRRLERIWIEAPVYFVTTCTKKRRPVLAQTEIADILIEEWRSARDRHSWIVGRYVIMPDHVHFFCTAEPDAKTLSDFLRAWKSWTSRKIGELLRPGSATPATTTLWQREFFDHILRSSESYSEKWDYVRENPVRAGLVAVADDWQFAGEIENVDVVAAVDDRGREKSSLWIWPGSATPATVPR